MKSDALVTFMGDVRATPEWKCKIYPIPTNKNMSPMITIKFNNEEATRIIYTKIFTKEFTVFSKRTFNFIAKNTDYPYMRYYTDNEAILAIDTKRHLASYAATLLEMMPDSYTQKNVKIGNKSFLISEDSKSGGTSEGYYCNQPY